MNVGRTDRPVSVEGRDRTRLERVSRYLLRPPFALGAVQRTTGGQVRVHFKKPSRSGATYAQMSPQRFLARLCALLPPPGAHTVRYYSVLAPRIDVSVCLRCQGPMRVLRAVSSPDEIAEALHAARPPPRPSPRGKLMLSLP